MRIPLCASIDAEPERMVFRETTVIGAPFIHEGERAGRDSVPGMRRNQIKSDLYFCSRRWTSLSSALYVVNHEHPNSSDPCGRTQMTNSGIVSIAVCGSKIHSEIVSVSVGSLGTRLYSKQLHSQRGFGHRTGHSRIIGL